MKKIAMFSKLGIDVDYNDILGLDRNSLVSGILLEIPSKIKRRVPYLEEELKLYVDDMSDSDLFIFRERFEDYVRAIVRKYEEDLAWCGYSSTQERSFAIQGEERYGSVKDIDFFGGE